MATKSPHKSHSTQEQEGIALLKEQAISYYRQLPVKKLAAAKVGRDYDTLLDWEKADPVFSGRLQEAKADWAVEQAKNRKMTPQFLLERVLKESFGNNLDITSNGEKIGELSAYQSEQLLRARANRADLEGDSN